MDSNVRETSEPRLDWILTELEYCLRDDECSLNDGYFDKNIDILIGKTRGSSRQAKQRYLRAVRLLRRLHNISPQFFAWCSYKLSPSVLGRIKDGEIQGFLGAVQRLKNLDTFSTFAQQLLARREDEVKAGTSQEFLSSQKVSTNNANIRRPTRLPRRQHPVSPELPALDTEGAFEHFLQGLQELEIPGAFRKFAQQLLAKRENEVNAGLRKNVTGHASIRRPTPLPLEGNTEAHGHGMDSDGGGNNTHPTRIPSQPSTLPHVRRSLGQSSQPANGADSKGTTATPGPSPNSAPSTVDTANGQSYYDGRLDTLRSGQIRKVDAVGARESSQPANVGPTPASSTTSNGQTNSARECDQFLNPPQAEHPADRGWGNVPPALDDIVAASREVPSSAGGASHATVHRKRKFDSHGPSVDMNRSTKIQRTERARSSIGPMRSPRPRTSNNEDSVIRAAPFADKELVFFHDPHSASPPQTLLVSETLLHNIRVYFENSCRSMKFDHRGDLLTPDGARFDYTLCNDFDSYCFTATMLKEKGLNVEFRRALSKACALVKHILRAEHPRTLACFLEVFIHLVQIGLPEVTSLLCDYIKRMSSEVTRKGYPWGQICQLLGELDPESYEQAMAQIWKCTTDIFDRELGMSSRLAVSVRLDYVKRVVTNCHEEEQLLRDLLAQFKDITGHPTPRVMLNLAHNLNKQGHHDEAEGTARKVLSLLQNNEIYAGRIVERIESLKIISRSQFHLDKTQEAEQTMREVIGMIIHQLGVQHPWVSEFTNVLEGWLRVLGRGEDAARLRKEIEELVGKDETDE